VGSFLPQDSERGDATAEAAAQHRPMDFRTATRPIVALALAAAGGVLAQSPETPSVMTTPPVMNDVAPLPAEDRESLGAIVLENSMVRAQRRAFGARRTSLDVAGASRSARTKEELREQREEESLRLREMGAGSITPR
jgi:hypothetical protein